MLIQIFRLRLSPAFMSLRHKSLISSSKQSLKSTIIVEDKQRLLINPMGIEMLQESLYNKIFPGSQTNQLSLTSLNKIQKEFSDLGISFNDTKMSMEKQSTSSPTSLASSSEGSLSVLWPSFPEFESNCKNISEHFEHMARKLSAPYFELIEKILSVKPRSGLYSSKCGSLPFPSNWSQEAGWTRYDAASGRAERVPCPTEPVLVFDVETLVSHNNVPVLAAALSPNAWYSWCSQRLAAALAGSAGDPLPMSCDADSGSGHYLQPSDLISFDPPHSRRTRKPTPKLIIGHNVAFDRSFIAEEYLRTVRSQ